MKWFVGLFAAVVVYFVGGYINWLVVANALISAETTIDSLTLMKLASYTGASVISIVLLHILYLFSEGVSVEGWSKVVIIAFVPLGIMWGLQCCGLYTLMQLGVLLFHIANIGIMTLVFAVIGGDIIGGSQE